MPDATSAFEFLAREKTPAVPPLCVLFGDEPLLMRESLDRLRAAVLTGDDGELSFTALDGNQAELREVLDELATVSMFGGGRRMVALAGADKFVSQHRQALEDYCQQPRPLSVLVLEVQSWPANTRLYKRLAESGLQVNCNLPGNRFGDIDEESVIKWLAVRAEKQYQAHLDPEAAELLLEIVGPQLGRLDQELAKLSLLAGSEKHRKITRPLVQHAVGGWRAKTAWAMIEAALDGQAATALVELDRLLLAGEEPIALLAMMSGSLRRMAAATRLVEHAELQRRRISLPEALREAGVTPKKFVLDKTERQLRQIGRDRAKHIYRWLLEADLALKGSSSSGDKPRLVLEQLIVRLSRILAPASAARLKPTPVSVP
ncbi:MAG TPA: DNA polymerase III subunit delta [Pirellulales bacterium]|nr:DNA polymerase III subunit delta [Pirellulales bacterium]